MGSPADLLMTFEEAARLDPDRQAGELDNGRWVPVTRTTWRHGRLMLKVGMLLERYAQSNAGWMVAVGDPGAKLASTPDVLRGADVALVRAERVPQGKGVAGWLEGAPDLAVEIKGDAQTFSDLNRKAIEYLKAGSALVWVVDSDAETVVVFSQPDHVRVVGKNDLLDAGALLPGFSCRVAEIFE